MAEATIESSMSDHAESSTAAIAATSPVLSRNDDRLTVALRSETGLSLSLDELVHLYQTDPPSHECPSTLGTLTTTVPSSQKESSVTKPTSAGTSYVVDGYSGKGKSKIVKTYTSSLSATHGSGSEAEAEQNNTLIGVGDQFESNTLKGAARARKRPRANKNPKPKKIPLVIHYDGPVQASSEEDLVPVAKYSSYRSRKETNYVRGRKVKKSEDRFPLLADEESVSPVDDGHAARRFSRARVNAIIGFCVLIVLTFALSFLAAYHNGKNHVAHTKGIIFSAAVLISIWTILGMILAKRTLQEALLAGLFEFIIGFALVTEMPNFMGHVP